MKKILLIGKLNKEIQSINDSLAKKFQVQLCSESLELVQGMIKITKPDLVVISVKELNGLETGIFDLLCDTYSKIPVIVVGLEEEFHQYQGYFENEQFERFLAEDEGKLLKKCCERLGIEELEFLAYEWMGDFSNTKSSGKKKILIVDDSALFLRSTKAMLDSKYEVMLATSGRDAIFTIRKRLPDLILLDYEMPGWDGKATLEKIRADKEISDIPVIFLTSVADKEHIAAVLKLNPVGYFLKPLERDKLLKAIEEVLKG